MYILDQSENDNIRGQTPVFKYLMMHFEVRRENGNTLELHLMSAAVIKQTLDSYEM